MPAHKLLRFFLLLAALARLSLAQTTVTLSSPLNPSPVGVQVNLTATVTPSNATGRMTFYDGANVLGARQLASGAASLSTVLLPSGIRKLRAYYAGDATHSAASGILIQTVISQPVGGFASRAPVSNPVAQVFAIADLNGDNKADLVVNDGTAFNIGVLLGNGNGTFPQASVNTFLGSGNSVISAAAGDFNGDGRMDLVAATNNNSLKILQGSGDGTFQVSLTLAFPNPQIVVVGDFNGDGKADFAALSSTGISIFPGNGDGTFQTPLTVASSNIASMVMDDFNGDGKPDFATVNAQDGNVTILMGKGDGTFQSPVIYSAGAIAALSVVVGDFNGDVKPDLAVFSTSQNTGNVSILLGNGDGTFQKSTTYPAGFNTASAAVGDLNGDGIADLVFRNGFGGNAFTALLGNGDGTFPSPAIYPNPLNSNFLFVGEFNGDGRTDLVLTGGNLLLGSSVSVTPSGTPQSTVAGTSFSGLLQVTVKDGANPVGGATVTFTPPLGPSAVLSNPTAITAANGVAGVSATANGLAGSYTLIATSQGVSAAFSLTNLVGPPSIITPSPNTPQSTLPGTPFAKPLQVTITDSSGNPASGVPVTFTAPASGASAFLSSAMVFTNASGMASVMATANFVAGSYLVAANYQGLTATFSLNNLTIGLITATGGTPQSTPSGAPFPSALQATVKNSLGAPVSGITVTFIAPAGGASAVLSSSTAITNASGVASVTATANNTSGTYTVTASLGTLTAAFTLTNLSGSNLALGKTATQSSTLAGFPTAVASAAVDGNTDGNFFDGSVTHTNADPNAWWQVDLGSSATVNSIVIWGRTDCCGSRLGDYWVFVSNTPFNPTDTPATLQNRAGTFSSHQTTAPNPSAIITANAQGRYVRVQLSGTNNLSLAEVQILGTGTPIGANLSQGKTATQSSTLAGVATAVASAAVDGSTDGNLFHGSVTHTNADPNAWWQVDLGASATVNSIVIWGRTDCCADRLSDYWVFVSDTPFAPTDTPATLQNRAGTFSSHQTTAPNPSSTIAISAQGRYVRVQLSGTNNLSLAEVQVIGTGAPAGSNLSLGKTATQSSTLSGNPTAVASSAVDGNTDGNFFDGSVTHTNADPNAWWQVDLGASATVNSIVIWNRTDACCVSRLSDYWVFVSDTPFAPTDTPATLQTRAGTFSSHQTTAPNPSTSIAIGAQGRYVRVQLSGTNNLSLAEVQVIGTGAPSLTNLAQGKAAAQSSTLSGNPTAVASSAVDGNTDGNFFDASVTHTNADPNAWWQVDLGASAAISSIMIWNRTDCCGTRLSDYWIFVSDTPFAPTDTPATLQARAGTFSSHQTTTPSPSATIPAAAQGRYVRVQLSGTNNLSLAEVQIFGQ